MDKVVFLWLGSNNLEQRPVLIEQQVRVTVAEDARAFGGEHEQLVASVGHEEGPAAVLAAFQWVASLCNLALAGVVDFAGYILVALGVQLVRGVVADGGKGLDHGRFGGG
jgi:hypothetical protein